MINDEPVAGYAWSGPGSYCCGGDDFMPLAAWRIYFTNTEACPTRPSEILASLEIVSTQQVQRPSSVLPDLSSLELSILPGFIETGPQAFLGRAGGEVLGGKLHLTTYTADEIVGMFEATGRTTGGASTRLRGAFVAPRCSSIHD